MTEPLPPSPPPRRGPFMGLPEPDGPGQRVKMAVGLLGGIAVSAVAWGLFFDKMTPTLMAVLIGGKLLLCMVCVFLPDWRPLGQGLLA